MAKFLPIEAIPEANPEVAVPGIVVYKAYESYQGISQLIDQWTGNSRDRKIAPVPSSTFENANSSSGTFLLPRRPAPVTPPDFNSTNSSSGTYIMAPPSTYTDLKTANSSAGTYIMAPPSAYTPPSSSISPILDNYDRYLDEQKARLDEMQNRTRQRRDQWLRDDIASESRRRDMARERKRQEAERNLRNGIIDLTSHYEDQDLLTSLTGAIPIPANPVTPSEGTDYDYNEDDAIARQVANSDTSLDDMDLSDDIAGLAPRTGNRGGSLPLWAIDNPAGLVPIVVGGASILSGILGNGRQPPLQVPTPNPGQNPNLPPPPSQPPTNIPPPFDPIVPTPEPILPNGQPVLPPTPVYPPPVSSDSPLPPPVGITNNPLPIAVEPAFGNLETSSQVIVRQVPIVQTAPTFPAFATGITTGMILITAVDLFGKLMGGS